MIPAMWLLPETNVIRRAMSYADETFEDSRPDGSEYFVLVRPSSMALTFMRSMKPVDPMLDVRASTRAAALSEAMSSRCSRSSFVTLSPARRYVVDAARTSARWTTTASEKSGASSSATTAVITFVILAMERWSLEFDSQSTWPFSGL